MEEAARFWDLDEEACAQALARLLTAGFLAKGVDDRYRPAGEEPARSSVYCRLYTGVRPKLTTDAALRRVLERRSYTVITVSTHPPRTRRSPNSIQGGDDGRHLARNRTLAALTGVSVVMGLFAVRGWTAAAQRGGRDGRLSDFLQFSAPAGNRPASTDTIVNGVRAAILPNGRLVTPADARGERSGPETIRHGAVAQRPNSGDAQQRRGAVLADADQPTQRARPGRQAHRPQCQLHGRDVLARQQARVSVGR